MIVWGPSTVARLFLLLFANGDDHHGKGLSLGVHPDPEPWIDRQSLRCQLTPWGGFGAGEAGT